MKRSEMLDIIGEIIYESPMEEDCETIAAAILEAIEKHGMLPPRAEIPGMQCSDNYWEREDDTVVRGKN